MELLNARPDVSDDSFGARIGRGGSWVSAFRTGKRHANDIHLLIKIARYFHVSVGYLLGEVEQAPDPGAATLLATWTQLVDERDRQLLLQVVAPFRTAPSNAPSAAGSPSVGHPGAPHTIQGPPVLRKRRRR
jgi:transcriptional regulator with XRE-family HTH domain